LARSSRRPTFWTGSTLDNDTVNVGLNSYELVTGDLEDEQGREPTLVRAFGRLVFGGTPAGDETTHVANIWMGLTLGGIGDPGLPDPRDLADDRWIWTAFCRWVWYNAFYPVPGVPPLIAIVAAPRAYQGPWEMVDFESHAMRKARSGDSLILRVRAEDSGADTPERIDINGSVRALWKAQ